jgi:NAD(P)-dependent dehydrogenase (short-subunit alcohol dehydrogenase family)
VSVVPDLFDLTGRTAIITGGGGALGSAIAVDLARAGAGVAVLDCRLDQAERVREAVAQAGGRAMAAAVEVSDPVSVERVFGEVEREFGAPDVLVNAVSSAIPRYRPEDLPVDEWRHIIDVNLTGFFLCCACAGRQMMRASRGGSIVNFGSIASVSALGRGNLAYSVAKGGIVQLTRELAYAWADHDIRVNSILPAQFMNEMWTRALADDDRTALVRRVLAGIPLGRFGQPEDIVGAVRFLASDASAMVTGIALPVDGGNLMANAGASRDW